jgi:hypothetical protein
VPRKPSVGWEDPQLLLTRLAVPVPAHIEFAFVLLDPARADLMRRVRGPGRILQGEGLVGRVEDELDRLVRQVFALMVALFDRLWLRRRMVVVRQVGEPLIGLAAEETRRSPRPSGQR